MPELPEVEIIKRGLDRLIVGLTVATVEPLVPRSFPGFSTEVESIIVGSTICSVARRGKLLLVGLDSEHSLLIHLRMTGQLVYRQADYNGQMNSSNDSFGGGHPNASLIKDLPDKTTRVIFSFTDNSRLYFNDQRKFGYIKLVRNSDLDDDSFIRKLGPEPLSKDFTWHVLKERLPRKSTRAIKAALLDQCVVAGIGNIYADESLFAAGIHPTRPVASLSDDEIERLHGAICCCLRQSIADGGSTARNYVDSQGMRGEYLELHAQVFNRSGQVCARCGHPIDKIRVAGRGTHICSKCQK